MARRRGPALPHTCCAFRCHPSARQDLLRGPSSQQCPDLENPHCPPGRGTSLHGAPGQVSLNYSRGFWNDLNF